MYSNFAKKGSISKQNSTETVVDITNQNLYVNSFNKQTGLTEKKRVTHVWKLKKTDPLVTIELHNGSKVTTTPEHKYLLQAKNGTFIDKRADQLTNEDIVISSRYTLKDQVSAKDLKAKILTTLAQDPYFYAIVSKDLKQKLNKLAKDYGFLKIHKELGTTLLPKSYYHSVWRGFFRFNELIFYANKFNISLEEIYDGIESYNYRTKRKQDKSSINIKLPKTKAEFEGLFFLAGLFFGDGSKNHIHNIDQEIHSEVKRIAKLLNMQATVRQYNGKCPRIDVKGGLTLLTTLNLLFGYPLKNKSYSLKTASFLQSAPNSLLKFFIRGYFDTDGTVEKSRSAVSLTSMSTTMLEDLQLLLYNFDIASKINRKNYTLYIAGRLSLQNFQQIGFTIDYKDERFNKLLQKSESSKLDKVYLSANKLKEIRLQTNLKQSDLFTGYHNYEKGLNGLTKNTIAKIQAAYNNQVNSQSQQSKQSSQSNKLSEENNALLSRLAVADSTFSQVTSITTTNAEEFVYDFSVEDNKNFIANGIVVHNTTFSDNLLSGAGMMSEELAGKARQLDFHADEQERGITIDSAAVSMVHEIEGKEFLINLIDTPGHVDFGGDVTRAMRAVDGAITLICASEGVMPQTETVLRQALREKVKPVLFINKVDRLIKELQLTPQQMQERFVKQIANVNRIIRGLLPEDLKDQWQVNVADGTVAFGSAFHNWAVSIPYMKKKGITFADIIAAYQSDDDEAYKELAKKAPLHEVVLNMVVEHHPSPAKAQKYRVPKIWHGDLESKDGKDLVSCNPNGRTYFVVTKVVVDPQAGEIAAGRLFGGTMTKGTNVFQNIAKMPGRVQQVFVYNGAKRAIVDNVPAGNIVGVAGLKAARPGETITSDGPAEPFEKITHVFDPVVSKAIEASKPADLPKLIEVLHQVSKEDPTVTIEINEETGEHLMHGMGELHLEVIENRIKTEKGVDVKTSPPIVVYREAITRESQECEGKSPNKHNRLYFVAEPLEPEVSKAIHDGKLPAGRLKKKDAEVVEVLRNLDWDAKVAAKVKDIFEGNVFVDGTRGIVQINEIMEMVLDMFEDVMKAGPLAKEPCVKMKVTLMDCKLHEDAIHRGPAQMYPAVREGIRGAIMGAGPVIYEPLQMTRIEAPNDYVGEVSKLVSGRRGQLQDMQQEGDITIVLARMPVGEMFGWSNDLRSATGGRGTSSLVSQTFEKLPMELQENVKKKIVQRKGLNEAQLGA